MTYPVAWTIPNALTGAALDVPGRTLFLSPRVGGEIAELRCPFFFPSFWLMLEHRPGTRRVVVEVLRTFGDPVTIDRVAERVADGAEHVVEIGPTRLVAGQRLRLALGSP